MQASLKQLITQAIQQTPSADNSQPWHIYWHKNTVSISYDASRVNGKTFSADNSATLLCMGAAIENLIQVASANNIKINYQIPDQLDLINPVYCICNIVSPLDSSASYNNDASLFKRHTNRLAYKTKPLSQIHELKKMTINSASIRLLEKRETILWASKLVREASEVRFRIKEINEWLGKSFRFGNQAKITCDGLDVKTLDLPLGGISFLRIVSNWRRLKWLNKLGAYKFMSLIDSAPVKKAPALIAVIGEKGFHETLFAGQLMQRIWIQLNEQGIAVHPYYVISDQMNRYEGGLIPNKLKAEAKDIYNEATQLFDLRDGDVLYMLLRIGYPKKKANQSQRLPLKKICSGL